ncbi:MAG TPA: IS481 family transposase [Acidimicrobiia bacterium]|nr:IS481 family transposase [Acidimicrobiia bacterium]
MLVATLPADVNLSEWCRRMRVSRQSAYQWRARFAQFGVEGLVERPRAAKHPAGRTPDEVEDQIVRLRKELSDQGLDAGAASIGWHLTQRQLPCPSVSTIWRVLVRRGQVVSEPKKAPRRVWARFERERPNELWQIDATHYPLADGTVVEIINQLDDCSRVNVDAFGVWSCTSPTAVQAFHRAAQRYGLPAELLSDNGRAFTCGDTHVKVVFEATLERLGIRKFHSSPYHPQTCGKVERFHQTQKRWLRKQPQPETLEELQALLDEFRVLYNEQRPHRALNRRTPASVWAEKPKAQPARLATVPSTTITTRLVNGNGTLAIDQRFLIGIGLAYQHQTVTVIRTGDHITIAHPQTAEVLRDLTLDRTRTYQPQHP